MVIIFKIFGAVILIIGLYFSGYSGYELYESFRVTHDSRMIEIDGVITGNDAKVTKGANSMFIGSEQTNAWLPQPQYSYSKADGEKVIATDPNYNLWEIYKTGDKVKILINKSSYERKPTGDKALDILYQDILFTRINDLHTRYAFYGVGLVFGILLIVMSWIPLIVIKSGQ